MLKIIVKNKETREQRCVDIPKERENDSGVKALKIGMTVMYLEKLGYNAEVVEVVKIVDDRFLPNPYTGYPRAFHSGRTGRATSTKQFSDNPIRQNKERKEQKECRGKPYFGVRLDIIKGKPDGKENLEKMKFPCWCVFKYRKDGKHRIGMLVTGFPNNKLEYQLIDMMEQVSAKNCCTIYRENNLEKLMEKCYIEVIKGQTQLWKIGGFSV